MITERTPPTTAAPDQPQPVSPTTADGFGLHLLSVLDHLLLEHYRPQLQRVNFRAPVTALVLARLGIDSTSAFRIRHLLCGLECGLTNEDGSEDEL